MNFPQFGPICKFNEKHTRLQEIKERLFGINTTTLIKIKDRIFRLISALSDASFRTHTENNCVLVQDLNHPFPYLQSN